MKKVTLSLDTFIYVGLDDYLKTVRGISNVEVDFDKSNVYIEYDESLVFLNIILKEVLLYLDSSKIPILISFNKHTVDKYANHEIVIEDICCEYCLKGFIEKLLFVDGIEEVSTNFDNNTMFNVSIFLKYDDNIITEDKLKELKNSY